MGSNYYDVLAFISEIMGDQALTRLMVLQWHGSQHSWALSRYMTRILFAVFKTTDKTPVLNCSLW